MDQKTIKLWEEYKKYIEEERIALLEIAEKARKYALERFKVYGLKPIEHSIGEAMMGLPPTNLMIGFDRKEEEIRYKKPTLEGFMDWLSNRLTKK